MGNFTNSSRGASPFFWTSQIIIEELWILCCKDLTFVNVGWPAQVIFSVLVLKSKRCNSFVDIVKYIDSSLAQKISKLPCLKSTENSFHEDTQKGLDPCHLFLFKISQQIWSLEAAKVFAKMGCSWHVNWAMAKIFLSN